MCDTELDLRLETLLKDVDENAFYCFGESLTDEDPFTALCLRELGRRPAPIFLSDRDFQTLARDLLGVKFETDDTRNTRRRHGRNVRR